MRATTCIAKPKRNVPRVFGCIFWPWDGMCTWRLGDLAVNLRGGPRALGASENNSRVCLRLVREHRVLRGALLDRDRPPPANDRLPPKCSVNWGGSACAE